MHIAFSMHWAIILSLSLQFFAGDSSAQTVARFVTNDTVGFIPFPDAETAVIGFLDWKPAGNVRIKVGPKTKNLVLLGRLLGATSDTSIRVEGENNLTDVHLLIDNIDVVQGVSLAISADRYSGKSGSPIFGKSRSPLFFDSYRSPTKGQAGLNFTACGEAVSAATSSEAKSSIVTSTAAGLPALSTGLALMQAQLLAIKASYPRSYDGSFISVPDSFWTSEYSAWKANWDRYQLDYRTYENLYQDLESAINQARDAKIPDSATSGMIRRLTLSECASSAGIAVGDWSRAWEVSVLPSLLVAAKQAMDQQRWQEALKLYSYLSHYKPMIDVGAGVSAEAGQVIDSAISDRARFGAIFKTTIPVAPQSAEFLAVGMAINDLVSLARAPAPTHITPRFSAVDGARQKGSVLVDPSGNLTLTVFGSLVVDPAVALAANHGEYVVSTPANALEALDVSIESAAWKEGNASAWRAGNDLSISLTMPRSRAALVLHQMRSLTGVPVTLRIKRTAQQRDSFVDIEVIVRLRSHVGLLPIILTNDHIANTSNETVSISHVITQSDSDGLRLLKTVSTCQVEANASIPLTQCFGKMVTAASVTQFVFETSAVNDSTEAAYFDFVQNDLMLGVSVQCALPSVHVASGLPFTSALLTVTPINVADQSKLPPKVVDLRNCGSNGKRDLQWIKPNDANAWSFRVQGLVSFDSTQFTVNENYTGPSFAVTSDMLLGFN